MAKKNFSKETKLVKEFEKRLGLTRNQAIGLVANLSFESDGLNPTQQERNSKGKGGIGYGQFTASRRKDFFAFTKEQGLNPASDKANIEFIIHELKGKERRALKLLKKTNTIKQSTKVVTDKYERPNKLTQRTDLRDERAQDIVREFKKSGEKKELKSDIKEVPELEKTSELPEAPELEKEIDESGPPISNNITKVLEKSLEDIKGFKSPKDFEKEANPPEFDVSSKELADKLDINSKKVSDLTDLADQMLIKESGIASVPMPRDEELGSELPATPELEKTSELPNIPFIQHEKPTATVDISMPTEVKYNDFNSPIIQNSTSINLGATDLRDKPGFFATAGHAFARDNEIFSSAKFIQDKFEQASPFLDEVPQEHFEPNIPQILEENGISDPSYWGFISQAKSQIDLDYRIDYVKKQMMQDEYYQRGSGIADFLGGSAGYIFSPTSAIPIAKAVKFGKLGKNVVQNMLNVAPSMTAQALGHNAIIQSTKENGNAHDFLINSAVDAIGGIALTGLGAGLSSAARGSNIYNARSILKVADDSVGVVQKLDTDGKYIGLQAIDAGADLTQAQNSMYLPEAAMKENIAKWQDFLDSRIGQSGLFQFPIITKVFSVANPLVRGLSSRFATMAKATNGLADHSFELAGFARGKARGENVEELVGLARDEAKKLNIQVNGLWNEANGIDSGNQLSKAAARKFKSKMDSEGYIPKEEFQKMVGDKITNPELTNSIAQVDEAARLIREHTDAIYKAYLKSNNLDEEIFSPRTATNYLMRMYDHGALELNDDLWGRIVSAELKRQDENIELLEKPFRDLQEEIKLHEKSKLKKGADQEAIALKIENAGERLKQEKENLRTIKRDNPDIEMLLDGRDNLSSAEEKELEQLLKPRDKASAELNKSKKEQSSLKKQLRDTQKKLNKVGLKSKKGKALSKEELNIKAEPLQLRIEELESKIEEVENLVISKNDEVLRINNELKSLAKSEQIKRKFFTLSKDGEEVNFRSNRDIPKFRAKIKDEDYLGAAESYRNKILNYNPDQINQSILSNFSGGESSNPLKERSLMIPDKVLRNNGFLSFDLDKTVNVYTSSVARRTAVARVFKSDQFGGGFEGLGKALAEERAEQASTIKKMTDISDEEKRKKLVKLAKDFKKATKDLSNYHDIAMASTNHNSSVRKAVSMIRNYTMATRLGAVPIASITDFGGMILKHDIFPFLKQGLLPLVRTLNGKLKTSEAKFLSENAQHASLAMEHVAGAYNDRAFSPNVYAEVPVSGKIETALEKTADLSMNMFGQTYMDNMNQRLVANISQSKFMNYLFKHEVGTITEKETKALLGAGIEPELWSKRMTEQFKQFGGEKRGEGYQSRWFDWQDLEAQEKMKLGVRRSVRESVLKSGWLDSPLWTNDSIIPLIFQFHKWGFSVMNRWTLPTMQKLDAQNLVGIVAMFGLGMLVDPLRKLAKGEEFKMDDDAWALNALSNSSIAGWQMDALEMTNAMLGGVLLPNKNDRKQQLTMGGILGGAAGGVADDIARILNGVAIGNMSQADAKKGISLLPMANAWYLRFLTGKFTESLNLPAKRFKGNNIYGMD